MLSAMFYLILGPHSIYLIPVSAHSSRAADVVCRRKVGREEQGSNRESLQGESGLEKGSKGRSCGRIISDLSEERSGPGFAHWVNCDPPLVATPVMGIHEIPELGPAGKIVQVERKRLRRAHWIVKIPHCSASRLGRSIKVLEPTEPRNQVSGMRCG